MTLQKILRSKLSHRVDPSLRAPIPSGWAIHHILRVEWKHPKQFFCLPLPGSTSSHPTIATVFSAHTDRPRYEWIIGGDFATSHAPALSSGLALNYSGIKREGPILPSPSRPMSFRLAWALVFASTYLTYVAALGSKCSAPLDTGYARKDEPYWLEKIKHQGIAAYNPDPTGYEVFRNVKDYGAVGDGVADDTEAIL